MNHARHGFTQASIALVVALAIGCSSPPSVSTVCNDQAAYATRCVTASACQIQQQTTQCNAVMGQYVRPDYLSALGNCAWTTATCDAAGMATINQCSVTGINASIMSSGFQSFAMAVCTTCPRLTSTGAVPMPTMAQCMTTLTTPAVSSDGGGAQIGNFVQLYSIYSDSVLGPIASCVQAITPSATCPAAVSACIAMSPVGTELTGVDAGTCPVIDPLDGTSWTSTTLDASAQAVGVESLTYAVTFGPGTPHSGAAGNTGPFSATLMVTYGTSAAMYPGCVETTMFTGGTWTDDIVSASDQSVSLSGVTTTTARTDCMNATDDTTAEMNDYFVNGGESTFSIVAGATMTVAGTALVPFDDGSAWTFTRTD